MSPVIEEVKAARIRSIMWTPGLDAVSKVTVGVNVGSIACGQRNCSVATGVSNRGTRCHLINKDFACAPIILINDLELDQLLNLGIDLDFVVSVWIVR